MNRRDLAARIDHTILAPTATVADAQKAAREAAEWACASVCVSPWLVPVVAGIAPVVCTVIGFPSGAHATATKVDEARWAAADGARELDMVINLGLVKSGDWDRVAVEVRCVRDAVPDRLLKVIIESAALDDDEIARATERAVGAGADFVKTSTGFHPAGGASTHTVGVIAAHADGRGVKAAGGIRTLADAIAMLDAGATRLGCSATAAILAELP